jgi:hypothetical protein
MDQLFGLQHRRDIHPYQTSPYMGRLKKFFAETDEKYYVLVSRDDAMIYFRLRIESNSI